jgi:hypothetical protein
MKTPIKTADDLAVIIDAVAFLLRGIKQKHGHHFGIGTKCQINEFLADAARVKQSHQAKKAKGR